MFNHFGADEVLELYRQGVFPMADSREDPRIMLIDPDVRGVFDLNNFMIPSRLARKVRKQPFIVTANQAFRQIIENCAEISDFRRETWINNSIIQIYDALHRRGHAHSIEVWQNDELVGGLYGVAIGGAFFGESMYSRATDASKIALVHLAAALKYAQFSLFDAQFYNPHLAQFGLKELPRNIFRRELDLAIIENREFPAHLFNDGSEPSLYCGATCVSICRQ